MHLLLSLFFIPFIIAYESQTQIPDKFMGKWKVDKSRDDANGYYNYLVNRGLRDARLTAAKDMDVTKTFTHIADNRYSYRIVAHHFFFPGGRDHTWPSWILGIEFEGMYIDQKIHKITFAYDPTHDFLLERHVNDKGEVDVYKYTIQNNELVLHLYWKNADGTVARAVRFHVKQ